MRYTEVVKVLDFDPISVSDDLSENYIFRVEILKDFSKPEWFQLHVFRLEEYRIAAAGLYSSCRKQSQKIMGEDVALDWQVIKAASAEEALSKFIEEIESVFYIPLNKEDRMIKYHEVVKVIDFEPVTVPKTDSYYRFRVEVIKIFGASGTYRARILSFERFELQPTSPNYDRSAPVILVEKDDEIFAGVEGKTIDEVVQKVLQIIGKLKD
ncbi:MAG: hypothetical protein JNJ50_09435 [Acidobacteria bacterium]|nr:hypothetical protein [Acidobacteriota bacterium]